MREINERLGFLKNVGLEYLSLSRASATLSGGESQRIRLASQIGSGLTGVLYVLALFNKSSNLGIMSRMTEQVIIVLVPPLALTVRLLFLPVESVSATVRLPPVSVALSVPVTTAGRDSSTCLFASS